jgi:glutathionyl-hydroquinone reductase
MIERALHGLENAVSASYVDNTRDARGWAFRETYGPDPVNGFTLLRDAYEATEPGFDGHVSVPTLWDRETGKVVSNDFASIGIDLATQFGAHANGADTYPARLRGEIDDLDTWIGPAVNRGIHAAAHDEAARRALLAAFTRLDARLADTPYLVGDTLTEADVRLWVSLVRYRGRVGELAALPPLSGYRHLWSYARALYHLPAFRATTDFSTFTEPAAVLPGWEAAPVGGGDA